MIYILNNYFKITKRKYKLDIAFLFAWLNASLFGHYHILIVYLKIRLKIWFIAEFRFPVRLIIFLGTKYILVNTVN